MNSPAFLCWDDQELKGARSGLAVPCLEHLPWCGPRSKEESIYDKIWSLATIYENKENPLLQKLALTGRHHGQYYIVDDGNSSDDE